MVVFVPHQRLVKSPPCAIAIVFLLAFAHALGVACGLFDALLLFSRGEAAFLGAADALMSIHAFKEELGGADGDLGRCLAVIDFQRRELFEEALNLLELGERAGGGL